VAELVHCNSCGGSFRYDPPPRRSGECHDGGDGCAIRCRRCGRAVSDPPPVTVARVLAVGADRFRRFIEAEVAAGHRYYDQRDREVDDGWKVSAGDYRVEGLSIGERRRG
jgi:hypothetical protein